MNLLYERFCRDEKIQPRCSVIYGLDSKRGMKVEECLLGKTKRDEEGGASNSQTIIIKLHYKLLYFSSVTPGSFCSHNSW